jgi:hypothetical protein
MFTRSTRSSGVCALALVFAAVLHAGAVAQPVTAPITYQGRLEQSGAPVTQVRDLRFELFSAEQGGTPLASVDSLGVAITGGLFTVPLTFPAGAFEGAPRYVQVTLLPRVSGERAVVLPRQLLGSVPRAESVRGLAVDGAGKVGVGGPAGADALTLHGTLALSGAGGGGGGAGGGGVRFADGTVQTTAAITPPPAPQLLYVPGTEPVVDLSGEPVTLAEPISVSYDVAETQVVGPQPVTITLPGRLTVSPVVVRRPFTGATNWRDLYIATIQGSSPPPAANRRSLRVLSLTPGGANDCSFSLTDLKTVGHRVFTVGTAAFEELRLHQTTLAASAPVWSSGATGNGAKFEGTSALGVTLAGVALPGVDVVSYESTKEVVTVTGAPGTPTTFVFGRTLRPSYVFRTPFGAAPALGAWFAATPGSGTARQRAFSVTGPGGFSLPAYVNTAWVHTYRVVPGAGGQLTEEWMVTSNFVR